MSYVIILLFLFIVTIQQAEQRSVEVIKRLVARASAFIIIFFICGFPAFVASIVVWKERTALTVLETPDLVVLYCQVGYNNYSYNLSVITICKGINWTSARVSECHCIWMVQERVS